MERIFWISTENGNEVERLWINVKKVSCTGLENMEKNLYPKSMDGLCRLYDEGILEDAFCETLFEEDSLSHNLADKIS